MDPPIGAWTIRPYRRGDEAGLVALFARVFGRPISEAHWRWKLAGHQWPAPNVFVAVVPGAAGADRPIFQCAAIPTRYLGPGGEVTGMIAVDAMTDPDFRRRGVMTAVSRHAYAQWREAGASFVVGLPNEQWGSRTRALGWQPVGPLAWRIRPLRPERMAARRFGRAAGLLATPIARAYRRYGAIRHGRAPEIRSRVVTGAAPFDDLWQRIEQARGLRTTYSIVRDRAWIERRYLASPDEPYTIWLAERSGEAVGYSVTRITDTGGRRLGFIAELSAAGDEPGVMATLVADVVAFFDREGAELAAALAVPGTALDRALHRAGFRFSWGAFDVQHVPLQLNPPAGFSDIAGGDFDVV